MSGHSKWATIKRKKGVKDITKAKVFTKLGHALTVASRTGGADPDMNMTLRLAVDKARAANMPRDTIERAIARGAGTIEGHEFHEVLYEAYGPQGSAFLIEALSDNKNRALGDIRAVLSKRDGRLADPKSVVWMFARKSLVVAKAERTDERELALIDAGAEDIADDDGSLVVTAPPEALDRITALLAGENSPVEHAELTWIAHDPIAADATLKEKVRAFVDALEELDDVQTVVTNIDLST